MFDIDNPESKFQSNPNSILFLGVFKWAETHQAPGYTNWLSGEPNNGDNTEDCVQFCSRDDGASFGWNDMPYDTTIDAFGDGLFALCRMDDE